MTLKDFVDSLDEKTQYLLAIELAENVLSVWHEYANNNELEYTDRVVGLKHYIKKDILSRALETLKKEVYNPKSQNTYIYKLMEEFLEPITAIQDDDWVLPYTVGKTFHAFWNLLCTFNENKDKTSNFGESLIYVSINQLIDALYTDKILSEEEIKFIQRKYKR